MAPVNRDPRFRLSRLYTSGKWTTLFDSVWKDSLKRGVQLTEDGTISPPLTNREAVAMALAIRGPEFPLWYQFAAVAYDWDVNRDKLDTNLTQMGKLYPADIGMELWKQFLTFCGGVNGIRDGDPRVEFDSDAFQSLETIARVRAELRRDGADAQFKIPPGPFCKDKKSGRLRLPRVKCDPDDADGTARRKRKVLEPNTRRTVEVDCDAPGDCEAVLVDDPITAIGKSFGVLGQVLLIVGGLWLIFKPRRRRRS